MSINIRENLEIGSQYDAAMQVIMDGVYPPPFMKNMSDAAMDEFERAFDEAMRFIYGDIGEEKRVVWQDSELHR
jgi:hypothetical protein